MSWDKDSLWNKSKIYFDRAFKEDRTNEVFGLWCSMGLELLARSTIAHFNPILLAEPDRNQKNLLIALGLTSSPSQTKSIATAQVLSLCKELIPEFTEAEFMISSALAGRRNDELHTGAAAFVEYKHHNWIGGFYKCCKILSQAQNESLESLFGEEEAQIAENIIKALDTEVTSKVKGNIAAYSKVFGEKDSEERAALKLEAEKQGDKLSYRQHHKVTCPACGCIATVQGDTYGPERVENQNNQILVRQSVIPTKFSCTACGLRLNGYGELKVANVADHFTHRITFSPEEYYELIDPSDFETMRKYVDDYDYYSSYSNE